MTWEWYNSSESGTIILHTSEKPVAVNIWHADTIVPTRRDFRFLTGETPCPTHLQECRYVRQFAHLPIPSKLPWIWSLWCHCRYLIIIDAYYLYYLD